MKNNNKHRNVIQAPKSPRGETAGIVFKTIFLCLILLGFGAVFLVVTWVDDVLADTPELDMTNIGRGQSALIFDHEGTLLMEFGEQRSEWIPFSEISPVMIDAILAIEDSRYFEHYGVDWSRTIMAVVYTLENMLTGNDSTQGGSTLTQQLVNQTHLLIETEDGIERDNSISRKVQEIYLAMEVERQLSKEQIIEAYLNIAPFGGRIYGIQAAAEFYFGVDARNLTLPQAATLAGIVQLPSTFRPDTGAAYTQVRRNRVLALMVTHGFISQEMSDLAAAEPITDRLVYRTHGIDDIHIYQPFIDLARDEAERRFGITDLSGYRIFTTLERDTQRYVYSLMGSGEGSFAWPTQAMESSVAVIGNDGRIRALAHRNELATTGPAQRGFHPAVHGGYQVGSASKPIWAYGPAFELLDWGTGSMVTDDLFSWGGVGTPLVNNWNFQFQGRDSVRRAMEQSWNIPAVITYQEVVRLRGQEAMDEFINNLGIPTPPTGFSPAYAIGGSLYGGFSPLQMAGAYSAFANGGVFNEPFVITHIIAPDGTWIDGEDQYRRVNDRVMSEASAYMMNSILRSSVTSGTGGNAQMHDRWVAGKTGTTNFDPVIINEIGLPTNATQDAWFVGYSLENTIAVWVGHENRRSGNFLRSFPSDDTQVPLHLFRRIMANIEEPGGVGPVRPSTVASATVEWRSGTAEGEACFPTGATPGTARRDELFHSHAIPTCTSNRFGGTLDAPSNLRGNSLGNRRFEFTWDHEGEGSGNVSLSEARRAFDRGMALYRAASGSHNQLTQDLANLPIRPGAARMIIDEIQGGAGEMRYELIGVTATGSTRVLGTTEEDEITVTLSLAELITIRSFHVIARMGNRTTSPSNSVQRSELIRDSELEITIPNMTGWTIAQFNEWLDDQDAGDDIRYEIEQAHSATVPEGQIISTNPTGRMRLDQTLRVTVSQGPASTTPPATLPPTNPPGGGGGGLPPIPGMPGGGGATEPTNPN